MIRNRKALKQIHDHLVARDNRLLAQDGSCRDTAEGSEAALRHVWLIVCAALGEPDGDGAPVAWPVRE